MWEARDVARKDNGHAQARLVAAAATAQGRQASRRSRHGGADARGASERLPLLARQARRRQTAYAAGVAYGAASALLAQRQRLARWSIA